jgi:hypothetical protein
MTTEYSESALQAKVKEIGEKAIETYLYMLPTTGWDGSASEGFGGAGWDGRLPPVSGPTGKTRLKCYLGGFSAVAAIPPGFSVVGDGSDGAGSSYYEYEVDAWASIYEPWMTRIEQAFRGWDDLPDPAMFDGPIEAVRKAVTELTPMPSESQGQDTGGDFDSPYASVDLSAALSTIQTIVGEFAAEDMGLLISAFLFYYGPERVKQIMTNQGQVAIVLGLVLLGEQRIWMGARRDIMAIADAAASSMRPGGAGNGDTIDFDVVKAFADLAKLFVPGAVATAIDAGEKTIDIVTQLTPEKPEGPDSVKLSGYTVEEVAASMEEHIRTLDKKVFDSEYELINKTLEGMLDYMWGNNATQFHINPGGGIEPDFAKADKLDVRPKSLKMVGYQLVPQVAAYMGKAAEAGQAANNAGIWSRTFVGYVSSGPYNKWVEVLNQFDKVTTGSASELVEAGKLLAIGAGWLEDTDGDTKTALTGVDDDIARGQHGWDNTPPPPPPTYFTLPNGKRIPI